MSPKIQIPIFSGSDEDRQMTQLLDEKMKYGCFDKI
jgi:hypothetical protein